MYKRQIYQIAESNRIEKIDSVAKIESNRNFFLPELECSSAKTFLYSGFIDDAVFSHNRGPCVDACRYRCSDVALVDVVLFLNFVNQAITSQVILLTNKQTGKPKHHTHYLWGRLILALLINHYVRLISSYSEGLCEKR